jgi:hypothetical protein
LFRRVVKKCIHPKSQKVWLALFTYFHTRAIHIELVQSCSTQDFLFAFRKFVGHCGQPLIFYSNNTSYFKTADKYICELFKNVNFERILNEKFNGESIIQWRFSTPEAPWMNGVTERIVKIFKRQFKIAVQ